MANGTLSIVVTGIVATCGTFLVGLMNESIKRHKERQGIAASLYTEVFVTSQVFGLLDYEESTLATLSKAVDNLDAFEDGTFDYPSVYTPVFDKCVEKIGIFDPEEAHQILSLYFALKSNGQELITTLSVVGMREEMKKAILTDLIRKLKITSELVQPVLLILSKVRVRKWGVFGVFQKVK